jgi:transcriptional regulator with XRE-family HTH domain
MGELFQYIMDSNGYSNLHQLAEATSFPYQTLWSWQNGSRSAKRPPAAAVLRRFAGELNVPESIVFRAAGRAYSDPGALDEQALELVNLHKALPPADQRRLISIVATFGRLQEHERVIAEAVVRAIAAAGGKTARP